MYYEIHYDVPYGETYHTEVLTEHHGIQPITSSESSMKFVDHYSAAIYLWKINTDAYVPGYTRIVPITEEF